MIYWQGHYNLSSNSFAGRAFNFPCFARLRLSTASFISSKSFAFTSDIGFAFANGKLLSNSNI